MKPDEFVAFDDRMPIENVWLVVTNNIKSLNAHGMMSHVWLTTFVTKTATDGIVTFDAADRKICHLTHYFYV